MKVRFGVIADLHTEYIHDGASRFKRFLDACITEKVDFGIQLGDFCPPGEKNAEQKKEIMSLLRGLSFPFYHVYSAAYDTVTRSIKYSFILAVSTEWRK